MRTRPERIAALILGILVTLLAEVAPIAAQGLSVSGPAWTSFATGTSFVIDAFQEAHRVRVCVTESTPASPDLGVWVIADDSQIVVTAPNCGEIVGTRITVEPAGAFGGNRQVKGFYSILD
jgi:hypothetical protein